VQAQMLIIKCDSTNSPDDRLRLHSRRNMHASGNNVAGPALSARKPSQLPDAANPEAAPSAFWQATQRSQHHGELAARGSPENTINAVGSIEVSETRSSGEQGPSLNSSEPKLITRGSARRLIGAPLSGGRVSTGGLRREQRR
jgi:hypothetical protein